MYSIKLHSKSKYLQIIISKTGRKRETQEYWPTHNVCINRHSTTTTTTVIITIIKTQSKDERKKARHANIRQQPDEQRHKFHCNSIKHRSREDRQASVGSALTLAVIYRGPGEPGRTLTGVRARDVRAFGVDSARARQRSALVDVRASTSCSHFLHGCDISGRAGTRVVAGRVCAHGVGTARRRLALVHVCVSGQGEIRCRCNTQ